MVNKRAVRSYIANAIKEKRKIDNENRRIRKKINSDIYQIMDTRGYEWQLQKNLESRKRWNNQINLARRLLKIKR